MGRFLPLHLSSTMPFGKHIGTQIEDLIHDEPGYVAWLYEKEAIDFDEGVIKLMEEKKII